MEDTLKDFSFEQALSELETIVRSLESGEAALEDSITSYERGIALKLHCESKLKEAREKIEKITVSPHGEISSQPLDTQE